MTIEVGRGRAQRHWTPPQVQALAAEVGPATAARLDAGDALGVADAIEALAADNHRIHDVECINLNPATNVMNPRAEALLSANLGTRASLGSPGDKYETGLEAIERIELVAAELACRVFAARYAEVRVGSGALANLYAFLATGGPGATIIAPPAEIGGHVTHHAAGAAGLVGVTTVPAPIRAADYTIDVDALRVLAHEVRPALITVGGSLNLAPHPVAAIRGVADEVGARVLFDAAHLSGPIAGGAWPNPLADGAHLMTMSTYKSLAGPPGGLIVTDDAELAQRLDAIAYPGLTANFDPGKIAALAMTLVDWVVAGPAYARAMLETAAALAESLSGLDVPVHTAAGRPTVSHQLAVQAARYGGGQRAARRLRQANLLACGIGLPLEPVAGDTNGLRLGTPEVARLGMSATDMPDLAAFVARGLTDEAAAVGPEVTAWRAQFSDVHFTADRPD